MRLGMRGLALTYFSFFCCAGDDDLARPRAAGLRQAVPRAGEPDRRSLRPRPPLLKPRIQVQRERPFGTKRIGEGFWRRLQCNVRSQSTNPFILLCNL